MTVPKGVPRAESGYRTHNWCIKCEKWFKGKPVKCPDCNYRCRTKSKYIKHKVFNRIG